MTRRTVVLSAALALAAIIACARTSQPPSDDPTVRCRLNTPSIAVTGGTVTLHVSVAVPHGRIPDRRPLNLAVVIDRSGSMSDENKMEYATSALAALIRQLNSEDVLSIVMYDDVVDVLRPAERVHDRTQILRLLEEITPRGSTNLGAGMQEGFRQAAKGMRRGSVNRVLLISDGLANTGITDTPSLSRIARRQRNESISLTSMGVGLAYNENLMSGLAESGGGNYYFIERPEQIASIFRNEFQMLSRLYAHNATIELRLHPCAHLRGVIGSSFEESNRVVRIPLGDVYYDETREVAVTLDVAEGAGTVTLAEGSFQIPAEGTHPHRKAEFQSDLAFTKDSREIENRRDMEAQAKIDVLQATKAVDEALELFDAGDRKGAAARLQAADNVLSASPAAVGAGASSEAVQEQRTRMEAYGKQMKDEAADSRLAKKAIQYDNYRVQKQKK